MITHTQELGKNRVIKQFKGKTSNIYIIEDHNENATYLIDCGMPSDAENLIGVLSPELPVKKIVCTHFHVDHVAGWVKLKTLWKGSAIFFHENAMPYVSGDKRIPFPAFADIRSTLIPCMKEYGYFLNIKDLLSGSLYGTPFQKGFPAERVEFYIDNEPVLPGFITIHTPGHRPDSVSFLEPESGVFISGDFILVLGGNILVNRYVSSKKDQDDSVRRIRKMKAIRYIYPGHGVCRPFDPDSL
ncbi:MAG: MBL fold metallo-hydrolase [Desulfobacteraceae bacterium]|nr:MAG: MBL fold metallo-hydrolase [Desulfobacteraceae bacterium]